MENKKDKIKDLDNQSWKSKCWLIGILEREPSERIEEIIKK